MRVLGALAVGAVIAALAWRATAGLFDSPVLRRRNWRGRDVPTGVGVLLALAAIVAEGGRALLHPGVDLARIIVLLAVTGFAALGLLDDVAGGDAERGWSAHLGALRRGRLSAGGVKLVGGGFLALVLASFAAADRGQYLRGFGGVVVLVADAALVALAANLANAFDRAPGRAAKVAGVCWLPLAVVARDGPVGLSVAVVVGAAFGLLPDDLGERLMLGDAGANALGATLGAGAVLVLGPVARTVVLGVLIVATVAADVVSFSAVIERTPVLRALDRLGRRA